MTKKKKLNTRLKKTAGATSEALAELLNELKGMVEIEDEFNETFKRFFDMADRHSKEFHDLSTGASNKFLEDIVLDAVKSSLGKDPGHPLMKILNIKEHGFWHGSFWLDGLPVMFFYFEDLMVGMIMVLQDFSGKSRFTRFTGSLVKPGGVPVRKFSDTTH